MHVLALDVENVVLLMLSVVTTGGKIREFNNLNEVYLNFLFVFYLFIFEGFY